METKLNAMDKRVDNLVDRLNHFITQQQKPKKSSKTINDSPHKNSQSRFSLKSCALLSAAGGLMLFTLHTASTYNPTIKDTIYSFIFSIIPRLSIITDRE